MEIFAEGENKAYDKEQQRTEFLSIFKRLFSIRCSDLKMGPSRTLAQDVNQLFRLNCNGRVLKVTDGLNRSGALEGWLHYKD